MVWQVIKIRIVQWTRRIILYGLYSVLILFVIGFSLLQIPAVQKSLLSRITDGFSKISGFVVEYDKFYLLWYDRLEITSLKVTDPQHNTLIEAERLFVNFDIRSLYRKNDIYIDAVLIEGAGVNLVTIPTSDSTKELNIDVFIAQISKQLSSGKEKQSTGGGPKINIGEVLVQHSRFSMSNSDADSVRYGFDPNHFQVALDEGDLNNFKIIGDTIEFNVNSLDIKESRTNLTIRDLHTFFRISQKSMEFLGLDLNCNKSHVSDTIVFTFDSQKDLSHFNSKVTIDARLRETRLHPEDISYFTRGLETWQSPVTLNGHFRGKINHFTFRPMQIKVGASTITGSLEMDGLPVIQETFINVKLSPTVVYGADLSFLFEDNINSVLAPLNRIQLKGSFLGFVNDFVANGDFATRLGRIQSDINYKIEEGNMFQTAYRGNLSMQDFDLGSFFKDTVNFQKVTFKGGINGKGFTKQTADFVLNGEIYSLGILGYNYTKIRSNARFANSYFQGNLTIDDPNLQLSMEGSIDLRDGRDIINIEARLDTVLIHELKLTDKRISLQSNFNINTRGLSIDSIVGRASLRNSIIRLEDEVIQFDSILLVSQNDQNGRLLTLQSSVADLSLSGQFYYSTLFLDIQRLVNEFVLNLKNDPVAIKAYYKEKPETTQSYKALINGVVHDANRIFEVLDLDLYISPEARIQGEFSNSSVSKLHAFTRLDTVVVSGTSFIGTEIEFNGSKIRDSTQVLAQLTINSDHQQISKIVNTRNLFVEGIWNLNRIDFTLDVDQNEYDNSARLNARISLLNDSTRIQMLPSTLRLLGKNWATYGQNYALNRGREWSLHQVGFFHGDQSVKVDGKISMDSTQALNVDIRNFDLSTLNVFSTEKFRGKLNAQIVQKDFYDDLFIENVLRVDSLTVNNFVVGDVQGNNTLDPLTDQVDINLTIDRMNTRIVDVKGIYDPHDKVSPLNAKAILQKANLKLIEPVVKEILSRLDGTITGEYVIRGTFGKPSITGKAVVDKGQVMVNYLKTLYQVKGTIEMTPTQIQFNNFDLTDAVKNTARLQGYIQHRNFSKMVVNLDAAFTNFQLLNTTSKDNDLFYGQAYGTGTLSILGPVSHLRISATASTNKNTRLALPLGSLNASQEKEDFIQFVSFSQEIETKTVKTAVRKREISGITLDLNIDVTPDAYTEIIFDIKSGEIIRGRGEGTLRLQVDTKGEFNMFGRVDFTEGAYNFTLYDILRKEFTIRPGSFITWYGNPYEAILNIAASYRQLTSIGPVIQDQSVISDPNIRRKYPVEVLLKLDGPMMAPQLTFDLEAKDLPDNVLTATGKSVRLRFEFEAFKTRLDEQELKMQVFSLIILRKLSSPNAFATSASSSIYNSVSEVLSNQLSYWLSQVDQNLEIDLDLGTVDQEAFNTFQLRLSYSFLNGRLRVSKDGSFGGNQATRSDLATIAGDWTVDYLLTPDGKFKIKMYSRSNLNQLQSSLNTQTAAVTTGTSLLYTENFNRFSDLLRSAREKRRRELESNPYLEENEDPNGGK
ncbi:MAG: translocation/assembly module TamB domain-containing protein [Cytophagales bacterium]|nr:translocation/assembly module TamB domain-containing protein [Cytophagales bacterium]